MKTNAPICKATRKNGLPCQSWAVNNSDFCFAHDPALAAKRIEAHRAGGYARRRSQPAQPSEPIKLVSIADVTRLLESEVNAVLGLEVSLSRAQTIARLAGTFIKAFEVSELERRLMILEQAMKRD